MSIYNKYILIISTGAILIGIIYVLSDTAIPNNYDKCIYQLKQAASIIPLTNDHIEWNAYYNKIVDGKISVRVIENNGEYKIVDCWRNEIYIKDDYLKSKRVIIISAGKNKRLILREKFQNNYDAYIKALENANNKNFSKLLDDDIIITAYPNEKVLENFDFYRVETKYNFNKYSKRYIGPFLVWPF